MQAPSAIAATPMLVDYLQAGLCVGMSKRSDSCTNSSPAAAPDGLCPQREAKREFAEVPRPHGQTRFTLGHRLLAWGATERLSHFQRESVVLWKRDVLRAAPGTRCLALAFWTLVWFFGTVYLSRRVRSSRKHDLGVPDANER